MNLCYEVNTHFLSLCTLISPVNRQQSPKKSCSKADGTMMKKAWLFRAFSKTLTLARFSSSLRSFFSSAASISIKRVTKSNFDSSLEELRHHVRAADFVSIDLEMTGVTSAPWRESLEFDRSDVRYLKVKDSAEKFAVVQFGVCPFRWDGSKESFLAYP